MISLDQEPFRGYAIFLVGVFGVTGALLLLGYLPTRSLGGQASVSAMFCACSVSLFASAVGALPIAWARKGGLRALKLFVAAMVLTPADPTSMLILAMPLTCLYFLGVALCKYLPKRESPFGEGYDPE